MKKQPTKTVPVDPFDDTPASWDKKEKRADLFPLVSVMSKPDMALAIKLMSEEREWAEAEDGAAAERAKCRFGYVDGAGAARAGLAQLATKYSLDGFRYGPYVTYYNGSITRQTFDKKEAMRLLVEAGVKASLIEQVFEEAHKEGKPFMDVRVKKI